MFKIVASCALIFATLAGAAPSFAADGATMAQRAAAPAPSRASAPELTAAQRQRVEALRAQSERELAPLREQLAAKRRELNALWAVDKPDRAAIVKKQDEMADLQRKMRRVLLDQRLAYLELLTAEQRTAWRDRVAAGMGGPGMGNMQGGRGHRSGMGQHHRGGRPEPHPGWGFMGPDDCMGYPDCDAACMMQAPAQQPPPAPAKPSTPASKPTAPSP